MNAYITTNNNVSNAATAANVNTTSMEIEDLDTLSACLAGFSVNRKEESQRPVAQPRKKNGREGDVEKMDEGYKSEDAVMDGGEGIEIGSGEIGEDEMEV